MATELLNAYFCYKEDIIRNSMNKPLTEKLKIFESSEKQLLELAFILSHKKTIKQTSNGSVLQRTQNFTISFKITELKKLTTLQAHNNLTHSKLYEQSTYLFARKEIKPRKLQQYFYDTLGRLST